MNNFNSHNEAAKLEGGAVPDLQTIHRLNDEVRNKKRSFEGISQAEDSQALKYICGSSFDKWM